MYNPVGGVRHTAEDKNDAPGAMHILHSCTWDLVQSLSEAYPPLREALRTSWLKLPMRCGQWGNEGKPLMKECEDFTQDQGHPGKPRGLLKRDETDSIQKPPGSGDI